MYFLIKNLLDIKANSFTLNLFITHKTCPHVVFNEIVQGIHTRFLPRPKDATVYISSHYESEHTNHLAQG